MIKCENGTVCISGEERIVLSELSCVVNTIKCAMVSWGKEISSEEACKTIEEYVNFGFEDNLVANVVVPALFLLDHADKILNEDAGEEKVDE